MKKSLFQFLNVLTLLLVCNFAYAATRDVEVYMANMQPKKLIHEDGDHIYININEYPSDGFGKVMRVPGYPDHWESRIIPCLKPVKIWSGSVSDNNSVVVLFTIMDQTFAVFEDDNDLGSIMVEFCNHNGKVKTKWSIPDVANQPKIDQRVLDKPKYMLFGAGGQYMVEFKVVVKQQDNKEGVCK